MMGWAIGLLVTMVVGVALWVRGWRGRREGDGPFCRRCGFDLRGRPEGVQACGECGADLLREGAVVRGERRKLRGMMWTGAMVVVVAGVLLGGAGYASWSGTEVRRYLPLWMLESQIASASPDAGAGMEIVRRIKAGGISGARLAGLIDRALEVQGDSGKPWNRFYEEIIREGGTSGGLTAGQVERLFWNSNEEKVECKGRVRQGSRFKARFYAMERRVVPGLEWKVGGKHSAVTLGGVEIGKGIRSMLGGFGLGVQMRQVTYNFELREEPVGKQALEYGIDYDVRIVRPFASPRATFRREIKVPMEVVAADGQSDEWVKDPGMEGEMLKSFADARFERDGEELVWQVRLSKPTLNVAMKLQSWEGERMLGFGGSLFMLRGEEDRVFVWRAPLRGKTLTGPVRLLLIPSPEVADDKLFRVERYWGREAAFENVAVMPMDLGRSFNMDESLRGAVERAIRVTSEESEGKVSFSVDFENPPVDLQYALVVRRGGEAFSGYPVGGRLVVARVGGSAGRRESCEVSAGKLGGKFAAGEKLEVELRPYLWKEYDARHRPWGGRVVIKDVLVKGGG